MRVTVKQLEQLGACGDQVALVAICWGESVEITPETCAQAHDLGLEAEWAAQYLLTTAQLKQYLAIRQRAWKQYLAIVRQAWKQYHAIEQPAWKQYHAACWQAIAQVTA